MVIIAENTILCLFFTKFSNIDKNLVALGGFTECWASGQENEVLEFFRSGDHTFLRSSDQAFQDFLGPLTSLNEANELGG